MRHQNTVFHALTKQIPWDAFDRLVACHGADYRVRRLDTKSQFIALLYGQLSGASSLREIEAGLLTHRDRLYHIGARTAARSTLADANNKRPWEVFADLFGIMVAQEGRKVRRAMGDAVRIIDSTKIKLSDLSAGWAKFRRDLCAAKVHIVYNPVEALPLKVGITPDNINDITQGKAFEIEPGATYIFDLGYYDYGWWADLDSQECRFVTRLKTNTALREVDESVALPGTNILSDRTGLLSKRVGNGKANPLTKRVREITVRIDSGKIIRLVTNDLDAKAETLADLYKQRWQIELFFKWIKQNLKIKHVLGTSENAFKIQIFVALIAYLLLTAARKTQGCLQAASTFARLICINLMHRRPINDILKPFIPPPNDKNRPL